MNELKPTGWRLLIKPKSTPDKIGSIHLPDAVKDQTRLSTMVAQVISLGPDAYADTVKFPNGPWVSAGDWIIISKFAGGKVTFNNEEYRFLNDDEVIGTTTTPDSIKPAALG